MTVYQKFGDAVKSPTAIKSVASIFAEAQVRNAFSKIAVAADEAATSTHVLARLPSNSRLLPSSTLFNTAITGLASYDVGLGVGGAVVNAKGAALVSAATLVAAGSVNLMSAVAAGDRGKRLWELAGYTTDPGGMIDLIGTDNGTASVAGTIEAFVDFAKG